MSSSTKGVRIPDGTGKCAHPDGRHCDPDIVCGVIGQGAVYRRTPELLRKEADMLRETANYTDDPARFRSENQAADELEKKAALMEKTDTYIWCYLKKQKKAMSVCRIKCEIKCKAYKEAT
jgi:hypothetical protein